MIRLTRCNRPDHAKEYFEHHLGTGDNQAHPISPAAVLRSSWSGSGARELGIPYGEQPTASNLVRLARGLHPTEKRRLAPSKNRKRAYYDLTISPPKTISLAALIEPNHITALNVIAAHRTAVIETAQAVGKMILPRSGTGPGKWLAAVFHHTHTREGDPHLHSHLIVPNITQNLEGQWRAAEVVIAGFNRLRLELVYGHHLARELRNVGLGDEIEMRSNGLPELRSLRGISPRFSKAAQAILQAAEEQEEKERGEKKKKQGGRHAGHLHPRSRLPVPENDLALKRRRQLADKLRKPKPKDADLPIRLSEEADRWKRTLTVPEHRTLCDVLDRADVTSPRYVYVRDKLPPAASVIVNAAYNRLYAVAFGQPVTSALLLRATIQDAAGQHEYQDLRAACHTYLRELRAVNARQYARLRAMDDGIAVGNAAARIQASQMGTAPAGATTTPTVATPHPAPAPTPPAAPSTSRGRRR